MKRSVGLLVLLVALLIPREAWQWTFVRHGESPKFPVEKISGSYCITIVGHYTNRANYAAAGVRTIKWESNQPKKRQAEMLTIRTAFLDWFVKEWVKQGGTQEQALRYVLESVDHIQKNQPAPESGYATPTEQCEEGK